VLIEGILPEAQRLSRMMMRGMGELYIPKFVNYLERKDLGQPHHEEPHGADRNSLSSSIS